MASEEREEEDGDGDEGAAGPCARHRGAGAVQASQARPGTPASQGGWATRASATFCRGLDACSVGGGGQRGRESGSGTAGPGGGGHGHGARASQVNESS